MGSCCSSKINIDKHEPQFVKIKILINEISEYLYSQDFQSNPMTETLFLFINHLNIIIEQVMEKLEKHSKNSHDLETFKSVTDLKLTSFSNSLLNFYSFLQNTDIKHFNSNTPECLKSLREKMVDIQWELKNLLNTAITVIFPQESNKNLALKGVYKKDFDEIYAHMEKLFDYVVEKLKILKKKFGYDFKSIISAYFWLNTFCSEENQSFIEYVPWKIFKKKLEKFIEETLQTKLLEEEIILIKSELDKWHNNLIAYNAWDYFYVKTWSNYKNRAKFIKKTKRKIQLLQDWELKLKIFKENSEKIHSEVIISESEALVNGKEAKKHENKWFIFDEGLKFGNENGDHIKINMDENHRNTLFQLFFAVSKETKSYYLINCLEKDVIKVALQERPFILTNNSCVCVENKYFLKVEYSEPNEELLKLSEIEDFEFVDTRKFSKLLNAGDKPNIFKELCIKVYDSSIHKIKEYTLNNTENTYKIYLHDSQIMINSKEINESSPLAVIKFVKGKDTWVVERSIEKKFDISNSKSIGILTIPFDEYEEKMLKPNEEIKFRGYKIKNGNVFYVNDNIFQVFIFIF